MMMTDTILKTKTTEKFKVEEPGLYDVVFLNDNITPMEFVVKVLKQIFNKDDAAAEKIMLEVHEQGKGVVGSYPFEIAEQKGIEATMLARNEGYPLQIKVQKSKK